MTTLQSSEPTEGRGEGAARLAAEIAEAERQERERLAEALHDDALQRLLVARQDLAEASGDPSALRAVGWQLAELTDSLRALTKAMHEDTLAAMPLAAAIDRLGEDGARRGRFAVEARVDPQATGDHDPFVLGVVRELLTNVVKHAGAQQVEIAVTAEVDAVVIRVADDGRGMSETEVTDAARAGHLGHARLRRRLTAIGGALDVVSGPGLGTAVTCTLPLQNLQAQRTLEDALRRERRWSAALVAAMQDGFVVFRDNRATQVNDRFCAMTGFTREALLDGRGDEAPFWPAETRAEWVALTRDARLAGGVETQSPILRADGTRFPGLIAARAIHDDQGGYAGMLVTVKDITSMQQAAAQSRMEHELGAVVATTNQLRGLLDAARAVTDEDGLTALLGEIARTIAEDLGWAVVINLYRPEWDDFVVATAHGLPAEAWTVLRDATYDWPDWTQLLDARFEHRGAYVARSEEIGPRETTGASWSDREAVVLDHPDAWRPEDELLIPVCHTDGHFLGILSLDLPASGLRPSDAEVDVLVAIAAHAALALQHAQGAIESARHAAALDRLLQVSSRIAGTRESGPMLEAVADAVAEALGFARVVVEGVDDAGRLRPRATTRGDRVAAGLPPTAAADLEGMLDDAFATHGCFLLSREEALERMPDARRALLGSRSNGRGWRAWEDHTLLVPLRGSRDELVGVIWVDDPGDRLIPAPGMLQALHAFANQATAAMLAADRYQRLENISDGDLLTRLGNRRSFLRELDREIARSARAGTHSTLVLADVEGCDVFGPDASPERRRAAQPVLQRAARAFTAELRRNDRAFRVDGGLFAMLLVGGARAPDTRVVSQRLSTRLRSMDEGIDVVFGIAEIGATPEAAEHVLARAGAELMAARRAAAA